MLFTKDGRFISGMHGGWHSFCCTLVIKENILHAGDYIVAVNPYFNGSVDHPDYKKLLIEVYSTVDFHV